MVVTQIDKKIEQYSLLKHPFYQQWSAGTLTKEALCGYIKEYYHLVKAVPSMVEHIYNATPTEEIKRNLADEQSHIALWEQFALGMGISAKELNDYSPSQLCVDAVGKMVKLMEKPVEGAAAMYAYEAEIPTISHTKLEGLMAFYGINDEKTVEYFKEHETADIYHREVWKAMMVNYTEQEQKDALNSAVECLKAQNKVLDAVCEKYMPAMSC